MAGKRQTTGIRARHSCSCRSRGGGACNCRPSWEAWVYLKHEGRKASKTFPTKDAAKAWRADAEGARRRGALRAPTSTTVAEAAAEFMDAVDHDRILNGNKTRSKASTKRAYARALEHYVVPAIGHLKLTEVRARTSRSASSPR